MNKIAAIQMNSSSDVTKNLGFAQQLLQEAANAGAQLAVLPEMFAFMGVDQQDKISVAEQFGDGLIQNFLAEQAKTLALWIVAGTIPILTSTQNKIFASSLVYDSTGTCVARYDKIHLFDVCLPNSCESYQESYLVEAGHRIQVLDSPIGKLGLAVCYDLRFPELFRALFLRGAEIMVLPSAFTATTGSAHWQVLCRARAIENFCYFVGVNQWGTHNETRQTYGHSLIIEPWGQVLAEIQSGNGVITAEIDLSHLQKVRMSIPIEKHHKIHLQNKFNS